MVASDSISTQSPRQNANTFTDATPNNTPTKTGTLRLKARFGF
jgi:hypothetical protein